MTKGIVYCDECGQASGFYGEHPNVHLRHADWCFYRVEDYSVWEDDPLPQEDEAKA